MATSFISISSEAGWPDNPIKRLVWLRTVWANTGLFQLCVCLSVCVEISMSLCRRAMVYSQSPMVLRARSLSKKKWLKVCGYFQQQKLSFLYFITQLHHCIFRSCWWMAFLILVLFGIVLAEVEKTLVWSRPNARVFKVGWFWASQGSRHNDHISVWAEPWFEPCYSKGLLRDREHASTDPVREK